MKLGGPLAALPLDDDAKAGRDATRPWQDRRCGGARACPARPARRAWRSHLCNNPVIPRGESDIIRGGALGAASVPVPGFPVVAVSRRSGIG